MKYLILEQKYFELIEDDRLMDALHSLRNEIRPLNIRIDRTHQLTTYESVFFLLPTQLFQLFSFVK